MQSCRAGRGHSAALRSLPRVPWAGGHFFSQMANGKGERASQNQARSIPKAKKVYSLSPLCLQNGMSPRINCSWGEAGAWPFPQIFPWPQCCPGQEGIRLLFSFSPSQGASPGDFFCPSDAPPRSMTDAPGGEGCVIDTRMERLICSCQTGCQSGRYLGPKEKIKADKAFALALGRKLMGARGGKSPAPRAFP